MDGTQLSSPISKGPRKTMCVFTDEHQARRLAPTVSPPLPLWAAPAFRIHKQKAAQRLQHSQQQRRQKRPVSSCRCCTLVISRSHFTSGTVGAQSLPLGADLYNSSASMTLSIISLVQFSLYKGQRGVMAVRDDRSVWCPLSLAGCL